ncbi:MAG TPA: VOC family protein [Candidatus Acidoferrales bacterium]|nr:VOC family protein [Candidatus Acidoferrales bacterium]
MNERAQQPWMSADEYGRQMPAFTVNLLVRNIDRSIEFYRDVFGATVQHSDRDFAAMRVARLEFIIHADHTYDKHAWRAELAAGVRRGFGAELRLFHMDPDELEKRARAAGAKVLQPAQDKPHGWRDVILEDPDGYTWAIGIPK